MIEAPNTPTEIFDGAVPASIHSAFFTHDGKPCPWAREPGNVFEIHVCVGYGEETQTYIDYVDSRDHSPVARVKRNIWLEIFDGRFRAISADGPSLEIHVALKGNEIIAVAPRPNLKYFPAGEGGPIHQADRIPYAA